MANIPLLCSHSLTTLEQIIAHAVGLTWTKWSEACIAQSLVQLGSGTVWCSCRFASQHRLEHTNSEPGRGQVIREFSGIDPHWRVQPCVNEGYEQSSDTVPMTHSSRKRNQGVGVPISPTHYPALIAQSDEFSNAHAVIGKTAIAKQGISEQYPDCTKPSPMLEWLLPHSLAA